METPDITLPIRAKSREICLDLADCVLSGRTPTLQYVKQFSLIADGMSVLQDILTAHFSKIIFDSHESLPERYLFNCRVMTIRTYRTNDSLGFLDLWLSSFSWSVVTQLLNDCTLDSRQLCEADKVVRVIFSTAWNIYNSPHALTHYILNTTVLTKCVSWLLQNNHRFPSYMRDIIPEYIKMSYPLRSTRLSIYNEIILNAMTNRSVGNPNEK